MEGGIDNENPRPKGMSRKRFLGAGAMAFASLGLAKFLGDKAHEKNKPMLQIEPKVSSTPPASSETHLKDVSLDLRKFTALVTGDRQRINEIMLDHRSNIIGRFGDRNIPQAIEPYHKWINKYSHEYGVNPDIIIGIIGVESQARPYIQGLWNPNDIGLLQQTYPNVVDFLKKGEHAYEYTKGQKPKADDVRLNPEIAIRLGAQYLQWATNLFGGREDLAALSFYRGSETVVRLTENNMPTQNMTFYEWATSKETLKKLSVAGLTGEYLDYPLLVLAAAELANEAP